VSLGGCVATFSVVVVLLVLAWLSVVLIVVIVADNRAVVFVQRTHFGSGLISLGLALESSKHLCIFGLYGAM